MLLRLQTCKFSAREAPFRIASRNFSCVLRISFCRPSRLSPIDSSRLVNGTKSHVDGRCLVYVDHCGNDILFRHTFPLAPRTFFQRLDLHFFAFLGDIAPSCTVVFQFILTASFRIASSLAPCIQPPTVIHPLAIRWSSSVSERYCLRSVRLDIFV